MLLKAAGRDGTFPILLRKSLKSLLPELVKVLKASLAMGCIPSAWIGVRVVFIPRRSNRIHHDYISLIKQGDITVQCIIELHVGKRASAFEYIASP